MEEFKGQALFVTIYILEAHPSDAWDLNRGLDDTVCFRQPTTQDERIDVAWQFQKRFDFPTEHLYVDTMENTVCIEYRGAPERLFVVHMGKFVFVGGPGPFMYSTSYVKEFLLKYLKKKLTVGFKRRLAMET